MVMFRWRKIERLVSQIVSIFALRMDEMEMLDYLSEKKQLTKSVIIRDALKMYYKSTKYDEAYYEQHYVPF